MTTLEPAPPDDAMTGSSLIGSRVQRREDDARVRGQGHSLADLVHGALAAAFVRSPHAYARVVDVDVDDALGVDGLVAVYTYEDLLEADARDGTHVAEQLP